MSREGLQALILLSALAHANSAGFYTVVAPRVLRPNTEFHVAVGTVGVGQPTTVKVDVGGKQDSGGTFHISQFITVPPYENRIVKLDIGDIGAGQYNITAQGSGGLEFYNSTTLQFIHKSYSVFIQTDKAIYKPGNKVLFRAVVLDSHLKPSVSQPLDIHITDGAGNRVKQWLQVYVTRGVYSGELELSSSPVLGDWNISVSVAGQSFSQSFQVAEYILPKFEVTVDVPKHATFKDSRVVATVRAKYTYGKQVKGEATISAYPAYFSSVLQPIFTAPVRKVVNIDGKAVVEFDIVKELRLTDEYERAVQFDVAVEEALTGRRQNASAQVMLHKHKYKLELIKTSAYFKPGLKYTAFIKLTHHDGSPVQDRTNPVKVRWGFSYDQDSYNETEYMLNNSGLIELIFYPPVNNVTNLGIEAQYLDVKEWFSTVSAAMSPSNTFIQAIVKTEKPMVNEDVEIEVNSTVPLKYVSYQVLGRGDVITAATVPISREETTTTWRFLATYAMAPVAHVIVQYLRDDGEVVADALDIELEGVLQNFVDVRINPSETEPGASVELNLEAKPNSYIGLLGVDQSVTLLKTGNDIEYEHVLQEMRSYDASDSSQFLPQFDNLRQRRSLFWWPGSLTAQESFEKSGAVILTNGYVFEHFPWLYYRTMAGPEMSGIMDDGLDLLSAENLTPLSIITNEVGTQTPRVRANFPETWLWQMIEAGTNGRVALRKTVPDTITSWMITAFSVDGLYGLGLLDRPRKLRVFRPFFLSLDLPYSVIRGEIVAIPVVVFNYMDRDVDAEVTMESSDQFAFADDSNDVNDVPSKVRDRYRKKRFRVRANDGANTAFMITPKEIGYISIKVTATSAVAGDTVERKLLVKPEGETQYKNKAVFIDLRNSNTFNQNITLDMPAYIVPGSERIEVSAVGDILGPSIPNLANLIKMPFGCGEQNMLNFVPNIVIIEYLKNTQQLTQAVENLALRYLEKGYQQELTYRHEDGSFSAFGKSDPSGSTWLTAFVAKSFRQAQPYISVEEQVIMDALQWLSDHQAANGSFPEVGTVSHRAMQGGAANGLALTAYTLTAFLENTRSTSQFRNTINKAIDYIVRNLDGLEDTYSLAICSYALHLAQHPTGRTAFNLLETKAESKDDMKWFKHAASSEMDKKNPYIDEPNSPDVEMTAYTLLTYLQKGLVQDGLPIMRWLVSQQNNGGGFASTQDTVVALAALAKLAEQIISRNNDVSVQFFYRQGVAATINVNRANSMILQKQELPSKVREVQINAQGSGFVIAQISYQYNVNVTAPWPRFTLDPQVDKNSDKNHLQLSICSGFVPGRDGNESNMAVMEVSLPSGFTVDPDALPSLQNSNSVKRVETKDGDSVVMLYFDKMTVKELCPTVRAYRTHKVANQKPVPVTVYDYYDQTRRARQFYAPRVATLCDICEGEDCEKVCTSRPDLREGKEEKGAAAHTAAAVVTLFICTLLHRWL
ncbi:CD109 antigen-like isoform X2 [Macrosteles quadrilineatus]|uniref:CD109 antigen-like isoform X2 n=1 Tax=Macrosteles quadrilineatus TaxID=74068 RepID=UPI0023E0F256|nr:CD109 antigen-like isoform X2 [Macrosteles quadrilineatus]